MTDNKPSVANANPKVRTWAMAWNSATFTNTDIDEAHPYKALEDILQLKVTESYVLGFQLFLSESLLDVEGFISMFVPKQLWDEFDIVFRDRGLYAPDWTPTEFFKP